MSLYGVPTVKPKNLKAGSGRANRGKQAEKAVQDWLDALSAADLRLNYQRLPDARAARGALAAQPADFLVVSPPNGQATFLEVKEMKHAYRLPKGSFSQFARMNLLAKSGARCTLLVFHTVDKVWRCIDVLRDIEPIENGSWNLSQFPTYPTCAAAFAGRYASEEPESWN